MVNDEYISPTPKSSYNPELIPKFQINGITIDISQLNTAFIKMSQKPVNSISVQATEWLKYAQEEYVQKCMHHTR